MKQQIETNKAPQAIGPYSQGIIQGNFIFTAGQIHMTTTGELLEGSLEDKMHQVMKNLEEILKAAGVTFAEVVKTTAYVTNMSKGNLERINKVYMEYMKEPYPARETVCVKQLPKGAEIEISMIAFKV
ncbi:deaminase [Candidatus Gottesmanbacteria bacterium]|nr:deaminase [Candidatus Gottesmanbacteria bacterium]